MKIRKFIRVIYFTAISIMSISSIVSAQVSATYSDTIPTSYPFYDATCTGPNSTLSVTLPTGVGDVVVTGIDINYSMTALGIGWKQDQRSLIYCQNTAIAEPTYFGAGSGTGTLEYTRLNVDIANGTYSPGTILNLEMHAWRFYDVSSGCNAVTNMVEPGWTITVHLACPMGDILLQSQAEVDQFSMAYGNCNIINEDLTIKSLTTTPTDVSSLASLSFIDTINGELTINGNGNLIDLTGLQQINRIESHVTIFNNPILSSLNGLNNIDTLNGYINIRKNNNLISLNGLNNLKFVNGNLTINENPILINLTGLEDLITLSGSLNIFNNSSIESLEGLDNLTTINRLYIKDNNALLTISDANALSYIDTDITVLNNSSLNSIHGLNNSLYIGSAFNIYHNDALNSISFPANLTNPITVSIVNNEILNSITGLENLDSLENLEIQYNDSLNSLDWLNTITVVQDLKINYNNSLLNLEGLENLTTVNGYFNIEDNINMTSLSGLDMLSAIGGFVSIRNNQSLNSIASLSKIDTFHNYLEIFNNDNLTTLAGLNITSVEKWIKIINNDQLNDLEGLQFLKNYNGQLTLSYNQNLTECCVIRYLSNEELYLDPILSNNNTGCNSLLEIELDCNLLDKDKDGIINPNDNCPNMFNPYQEDYDVDTIGNACDNCPLIANSNQLDSNNNFIGNECEILEPGMAGINTSSPKSGLEISASELYLSDTHRGLIMTNALGECFRIYIGIDGQMKNKKIDCPN